MKKSNNLFRSFLLIITTIFITLFSLTSAGWHYADEIASGTFRGVYVFNDSVIFEKAVVIKGQTTIESSNELRPYVTNGFNLTFTKENETKQVILTGKIFQPDMELLNLPEGYTQSIEINSPYKAVIDITNSDFNSSLTDLTFSNHFPEEILMQVETILNSIVNISIVFKDNYQSSDYIYGAWEISTYSQNGNMYAAVIGTAGNEFSIFDITNPSNIMFEDNYESNTYIHSPRGLLTYYQNGNIYGAVTGQAGNDFSIFDITDPTNIIFKDNYQSSSYIDGPYGISTYSQNGNIYGAVTGQAGDEFSIFDITDPTNIIFKDNYESSSNIDLPFSISTYEQNGNMYAAVTGQSGNDFSIFELKLNEFLFKFL